ncbi:MAG: serpin family protein [Chitinophagales bacterium]
MKKNLFLSLWIMLGMMSVLLISCDTTSSNEDPLITVDPNVPELVVADNNFGINLFKRANAEKLDSNVFVSPLSVATALTMVYNGAESTTKVAMEETLSLSELTVEEVNAAYESLLPLLENLDEEVLLNIANSIWIRDTYTPNPEFINTNETAFDSEVLPLDFTNSNAIDIINAWVADKTNDKIDKIIDNVSDEAILYLINAIYFKGSWTAQFDPESTEVNSIFIKENGAIANCDMMRMDEKTLPYFSGENFQAVDLAYGDSIWSMSIFVPNAGTSVNDLVEQLNLETWNTWTNSFEPTTIGLTMPKFTVEYKITLNKILKDMGMEIAFSANDADFSRIGAEDFFINQVAHKTFIQVTEKGTEATAVTSVGVGITVIPSYPVVQLNKPFLYVIRERQHNTILFMGKMMNPVEE